MISRSHRRVGRLFGPALIFIPLITLAADEFEQHGVHEHGKLTIAIAVDDTRLTIDLDSPAMNVLGFERPPRSDEEERTVSAAGKYLNAGTGMFGVPKPAGCKIARVALTPPHWAEAGPDAGAHDKHDHERADADEHSEYRARYTFTCASPASLAWIELWLLERFKQVSEAHVTILSATAQRSEVVKNSRIRVSLR